MNSQKLHYSTYKFISKVAALVTVFALVFTPFANIVPFVPQTGVVEASTFSELITTLAAIDVTQTTATLNANTTSEFGFYGKGFEYGTDTSYGVSTYVGNLPEAEMVTDPYSHHIENLICGTTYHYRALAVFVPNSSEDGMVHGNDMTFSTAACDLSDPIDLTNPSSKSVDAGETVAITDLEVVGGNSNDVIDMTLYVVIGTLSFGNSVGLTFNGDDEGNNLKFRGTIGAINNALETLTYTAPYIGGTYEVEALIDEADGSVYRHSNGHVYKVVTVGGDGITWTEARAAAQVYKFPGETSELSGYLATIVDEDEHNFVRARIDEDGWFGASDDTDVTGGYTGSGEGEWFWVTGPEAGTKFWTGGRDGSIVPGQYANWNKVGSANEPNNTSNENYPGGENCAQIRFSVAGAEGKWNDLPCEAKLPKYVVEFGMNDINNKPAVKRSTFDVEVAPLVGGTMFYLSYTASSYIEHATGVTYTFEYVVSTPNPDNLLEVDFPAEFIVDGMLPDVTINGVPATVTHMGGGGDNNEKRTVGVSETVNAGDRITVTFEDITNPAAGTYPFVQLRTSNDDGEGTVTAVDVPASVAPIVITAPQAPFPGNGTEANPYEVTECFVASWSGYYTLMNDIDQDSNVDDNCIEIEANNVVIDGNGFTISEDVANDNNGAAVVVGYDNNTYSNIEIKNITISGYSSGVVFLGGDTVVVRDTTITAEDAVMGFNVQNATIEDNEIVNTDSDGIVFYSSNTITVQGNKLSNIIGDAIYLAGVSNATVSNNSIDGAESDGIDVTDVYDNVLDENIPSANITIIDNELSNIGDRGIEIEYLNGGTITGNTVSSVDNGIEIDDSNDITIQGNTFSSEEEPVLVIKNTNNVLFVENELMGDVWVEVNEGTTSNISFNQGTVGNLYRFANGDGAWTVFDIRDTNNNGYADAGSDRPFADGLTHNSVILWQGAGQDNHPATTLNPVGGNGNNNGGNNNGGGSGRSGGSSGSRPSGNTSAPVAVNSATSASDFINQYRSLFVQAHNAGITLPSALLVLLGLDSKAATPGLCAAYTFTRDLQFGDEGEDVRALQRFLNCSGFSLATSGPGASGEETQYFVERTRDSVIKFQEAYSADILSPIGLTSGTGIFSSYSRMKAHSLMAR